MTLALLGGGPFTVNDDLDRRLLADAGADQVVVLPTADAFENPGVLIAAAMGWGERLDVVVQALMVFARSEADEAGPCDVVRAARALYLVGDSPIHLRSVLKDTPLYRAVRDVHRRGGLVAAVGGSAAALCDPMTDPRGGAFTLGLGMVGNLAVATETETWSEEHRKRTLKLADVTLAEIPTGAALVYRDGAWERVGDVTVHGDLTTAVFS